MYNSTYISVVVSVVNIFKPLILFLFSNCINYISVHKLPDRGKEGNCILNDDSRDFGSIMTGMAWWSDRGKRNMWWRRLMLWWTRSRKGEGMTARIYSLQSLFPPDLF